VRALSLARTGFNYLQDSFKWVPRDLHNDGISQLLKGATTKHLSHQHKQPIDTLFLLSNYRFHTIFFDCNVHI